VYVISDNYGNFSYLFTHCVRLHFFKKYSNHPRTYNTPSSRKTNVNTDVTRSNNTSHYHNCTPEISYFSNTINTSHDSFQNVSSNPIFDNRCDPITNFRFFRTL